MIFFLGGSATNLLKARLGAKLFKDFQVLGRIWTHPWCLELHYIKEKVEKNTQCDLFLGPTVAGGFFVLEQFFLIELKTVITGKK